MDMENAINNSSEYLEYSIQLYTCPMCAETGLTDEHLLEHIIAQHNRNSFHVAVCPICLTTSSEFPVPMHQDLIGHLTLDHLLNLPDVPTFEPGESNNSDSTDTNSNAPNSDIFGDMSADFPPQINMGQFSPDYNDNSSMIIAWQRPRTFDSDEDNHARTLSLDQSTSNNLFTEPMRCILPRTAYRAKIRARAARYISHKQPTPGVSPELTMIEESEWPRNQKKKEQQQELEQHNFRFVQVDIKDPEPKKEEQVKIYNNSSLSDYEHAARQYAASKKKSSFLLESQKTPSEYSERSKRSWKQEREFVCNLLTSAAINPQPMKTKPLTLTYKYTKDKKQIFVQLKKISNN